MCRVSALLDGVSTGCNNPQSIAETGAAEVKVAEKIISNAGSSSSGISSIISRAHFLSSTNHYRA